jgi:hypothetical protein
MAKQKKKRTRGRQKSKAAIATAEQRDKLGRSSAADGVQQAVEYKGGGGVMTNLRGGFQSAVGSGETQAKKKGWLGTVLWVLLFGAAIALVFGDIR